MKNPNGYGGVRKLSGKRRKPFQVVISLPRDKEGNIHQKSLGCFATRKEAEGCLYEYNKDPYSFTEQKTFAEIYNGWHSDEFYGDYSLDRERNYSLAFNHCAEYHNRPFTSVKLMELQAICDKQSAYEPAYRIKALVGKMSRWAIARDFATKNYAPSIEIKQKRDTVKKAIFTDDEIAKVFADDSRIGKMVQVFLYSGLRRNELLNLRRENCHIDEHWMYIEASKTDNGIRVVPIHNKIYNVVKEFYDEGQEYVFTTTSHQHWLDKNWDSRFNAWKKTLGINHTTHETRHTFITMGTIANLNQTYLMKIVGHSSMMTITQQTYTHLDHKTLLDEINKIP